MTEKLKLLLNEYTNNRQVHKFRFDTEGERFEFINKLNALGGVEYYLYSTVFGSCVEIFDNEKDTASN